MPAPSSTSPSSSGSSSQAGLDAQPLISVVVPTRDRPLALRRCLEALSSQTVKEQVEVIVVDDGSVREDLLVFTPSNNLACAAEVLSAVPFDERYPAAAGEDREWCERLLRSGRVLRYEPSAVLVHHQDLDIRSFLRQQVRYWRGAFRFRHLQPETRSLERPAFYAQLVRRGLAGGRSRACSLCGSASNRRRLRVGVVEDAAPDKGVEGLVGPGLGRPRAEVLRGPTGTATTETRWCTR